MYSAIFPQFGANNFTQADVSGFELTAQTNAIAPPSPNRAPEPATAWLAAVPLAVMLLRRRRRAG